MIISRNKKFQPPKAMQMHGFFYPYKHYCCIPALYLEFLETECSNTATGVFYVIWMMYLTY